MNTQENRCSFSLSKVTLPYQRYESAVYDTKCPECGSIRVLDCRGGYGHRGVYYVFPSHSKPAKKVRERACWQRQSFGSWWWQNKPVEER